MIVTVLRPYQGWTVCAMIGSQGIGDTAARSMPVSVTVDGEQRSGSSSDPRAVLRAYQGALRRETSVLVHDSGLLFQQLHNRLQWDSATNERLAWERERRAQARCQPWVRTRSPFVDSATLIRTLTGHRDWVVACDFSPDGSRLVSASGAKFSFAHTHKDPTLKVWDTGTGREMATLRGHAGEVESCRFSPDGRRIASGARDGTVKIWDALTFTELGTLRGHTGRVEGCDFSPDGGRIVSTSQDNTVRVWDARDFSDVATLAGHADGVWDCSFSPDGRHIVSAGADGTLKVWDASTYAEVATLAGHLDSVNRCSYSPDGSMIASASDDWSVKIWDAETFRELTTLAGHDVPVADCCWSPDGTRIVSASWDHTLKIWDVTRKWDHLLNCSVPGSTELTTLIGHSDWVICCAFSPDGRYVASGGHDNALKLWNAQDKPATNPGTVHRGPVTGCAFSPAGRRIASVSGADQVGNATLKISDGETGVELLSNTRPGGLHGCAFTPEGERVVSMAENKTLVVWDPDTGRDLASLVGHTDGINGFVVSPEGTRIVSASWDHTLKVWDVETGTCLGSLTGPTGFGDCALSPDGREVLAPTVHLAEGLATADRPEANDVMRQLAETAAILAREDRTVDDRHLKAIGIETGTERLVLAAATPLVHCSFSPDGSQILTAGTDLVLTVWDAKTGAAEATLSGHTGPITGCGFTPDGNQIVSTSVDATLRIWDRSTGAVLARIPTPSPLLSLALHPWLPRAASGDEGGCVYALDLVGIDYGPIVVSVFEGEIGPTVRCPRCLQHHPVAPGAIGLPMRCPAPGCGLPMQTNPFVITGPPTPHLRRRGFVRGARTGWQ